MDREAVVAAAGRSDSRRNGTQRSRVDPARSAKTVPPTSWNAVVFEVIEWPRFEALIEDLFPKAGSRRSRSRMAQTAGSMCGSTRNGPGAPVSVVYCKHWRGR